MSRFPGYAGYFLDLAELEEGSSAFYGDGTTGPPGWSLFSSPSSILVATELAQVNEVLRQASGHSAQGGYAAGFLSYEASTALNHAIRTKDATWPVLAWFGLFDEPPRLYRELAPFYGETQVQGVHPDIDRNRYEQSFQAVKQALAEGRSYQVNLTFRLLFESLVEPHEFFASRCGTAPPPYSAFLRGGDWAVASFSPELLFERIGDQVVSRPMKGTANAPASRPELLAAIESLSHDPKSIAENVMIVDMVRNDLGSLCETGSVQAKDLFRVERYGRLLQMTSDVLGATDATTDELMKHLFPAASITGAPKVSTAALIADLEVLPRHVYCGAVGYMAPDRQRFSVAIRTALIHGDGRGEFGVGSGVVWDSDADSEYEECLAKAELLTSTKPPWALVDAIGRSDLTDIAVIEAHMVRLQEAANELEVPLDVEAIRAELARVEGRGPKVRIAVRRDGEFTIQTGESATGSGPLTASVALRPVQSSDPNLRFKTTGRAIYDGFLNEHPEFDEVLLWNERGEITEFCRGSVILEIHGARWSPHPSSGCLKSISVKLLVRQGKLSYRTLTLEDVRRAKRVLFVNAVTGVLDVNLSPNFS